MIFGSPGCAFAFLNNASFFWVGNRAFEIMGPREKKVVAPVSFQLIAACTFLAKNCLEVGCEIHSQHVVRGVKEAGRVLSRVENVRRLGLIEEGVSRGRWQAFSAEIFHGSGHVLRVGSGRVRVSRPDP